MPRHRHAIHVLLIAVAALLFAPGGQATSSQAPTHDSVSGANRVPLEGARNLRDLGGYRTLSNLNAQDWSWLERAGVHTIYDFRAQQEVDDAPYDVSTHAGMQRKSMPIVDPGMDIALLREQIMHGDLSGLPQDTSYAGTMLEHADVLREWFASIADPTSAPLVFHCTAGKDRTGVAALLLLMALGVPEQKAIEDFMATNVFLAGYIDRSIEYIRSTATVGFDEDRLRGLLGVEERNMRDGLAAVRQEYGSIDNYLAQALGVDEAMKARLRAIYLQ